MFDEFVPVAGEPAGQLLNSQPEEPTVWGVESLEPVALQLVDVNDVCLLERVECGAAYQFRSCCLRAQR